MAITIKPRAIALEGTSSGGSDVLFLVEDIYNLDYVAVIISTVPTNGVLQTGPNNELVFLPNSGFAGSEIIPYSLCTAAEPVLCDESTITVIVQQLLDPSAINDEINILRDSGTTVVTVLDNDQPSGQLTVSSVLYNGNHGSCAVHNEGEALSYTPNVGYIGQDNCVYEACNSAGVCDTAVLAITIESIVAISLDSLNDFDQGGDDHSDHDESSQNHTIATGLGAALGGAIALAGVVFFMRDRKKHGQPVSPRLIQTVYSANELPDMLRQNQNTSREIDFAGSENLSVTAFMTGKAGSPENRERQLKKFFGSDDPETAPISPTNSLFSSSSFKSSRSKNSATVDDVVDL